MRVSFTQFIDFVSKGPDARITFIKNFKKEDEYHPGKDYWKSFRDKLIQIHSSDNDLSRLDSVIAQVNDKKTNNYIDLIRNYQSLMKGKSLKWFVPPRARYSTGDTVINVGHELGLYIDGQPYLVKLVFSKSISEDLNKRKSVIPITLSYLATEFNELPDECKVMILDIRKKKMYIAERPSNDHETLLNGELMVFDHLVKNL